MFQQDVTCKTDKLIWFTGVKANGGCLDVDVSRVQRKGRPQSNARRLRGQGFTSTSSGLKLEIVI